MARKNIVVIGAGGMAREIAWMIAELNRHGENYKFVGYVVSDLSVLNARDSRDRVLGDYEWLSRNPAQLDAVTIGVGSPGLRLKIAEEVKRILPDVTWPPLVHPNAAFDKESAAIAEGAQVCVGFTGTVNLTLGRFALCNFGCTVGHESTIGEGSVINPGANISGGVRIGKGVLVGTGAQVLQYLTVGDGAVVGAGAVVTRDVAAGTTVVGIPARPR